MSQHIIHSHYHKPIVIGVALAASFSGFEALSQILVAYQISIYISLSMYVYLFLVLWQTLVFDINLKHSKNFSEAEYNFFSAIKQRFHYLSIGNHWLQFQNYLILPGIIYWSTVVLLFLDPFNFLLKQVWILLATLALGAAFWYLKTVFYSHQEISHRKRQSIFLVKSFATYIFYAASIGIAHYLGYDNIYFSAITFLATFFLIYQALYQHRSISYETLKFMISVSLFMGLVGYAVYIFWNVNFYSGALVMLSFYNTIWGYIHHKYIDKNLTRETMYEYLSVLFLILVIVISTTNFAERI